MYNNKRISFLLLRLPPRLVKSFVDVLAWLFQQRTQHAVLLAVLLVLPQQLQYTLYQN